MKIYSKK